MLDIAFITVLALVIWSMFKSHTGNPGKIVSDAEKSYRELMEEISNCTDFYALDECQKKIYRFRDYHSWKLMDGCDMVDSLQKYYEDMYDYVGHTQYGY